MNNIGDLGDITKSGPLIKSIVDAAVEKALASAVTEIIPGLKSALSDTLDGLVITIELKRRPTGETK